MAITIKREKNKRGVAAGSLKHGDTFLYDNRVGLVVDRNGHQFFLDLTTASNFRKQVCDRPFHTVSAGELNPDTLVLPVEVEMTYKVVG